MLSNSHREMYEKSFVNMCSSIFAYMTYFVSEKSLLERTCNAEMCRIYLQCYMPSKIINKPCLCNLHFAISREQKTDFCKVYL